MKLRRQLHEKTIESCQAVLPICFIVTLLAMTLSPLSTETFALFVIGSILLVLGMGLFTVGAEMSMTVMGEEVGKKLAKTKNIFIVLLVCFILGFVVTIAEPDLTVLATQVQSIPNIVLIVTVGIGVGLFLVVGQIRNYKMLKLRNLLFVFYALTFILCIFVEKEFIPVAFDSAGVTTGPITVPFIMAFGLGLTRFREDENSSSDSFGLISLSSIGPILAVLILSFFYSTSSISLSDSDIIYVSNMQDVLQAFLVGIPVYFEEVLFALLPILFIFIIFQTFTRSLSRKLIFKMGIGFIYTFVGLVLFLTAANIGFMVAGEKIGESLAGLNCFLLIPIGALIGYFIVKAEPAVILLTHQVEEVSNGSISSKSIGLALSIGIAVSIACAMLRVITGISILWFLIPGYCFSILLSRFVPSIYTGIAFDSGGVASGPMSATFLLPFSMGACKALGGNLMTDAFGVVAMVAMTPLITIQCVGLFDVLKSRKSKKVIENNDIIFFEEEYYA